MPVCAPRHPAVLLLLLSCPNVAGVCPRTVPAPAVQHTAPVQSPSTVVQCAGAGCTTYNTPSRYGAQPARHRDVSPPTTPLLVLATSSGTPVCTLVIKWIPTSESIKPLNVTLFIISICWHSKMIDQSTLNRHIWFHALFNVILLCCFFSGKFQGFSGLKCLHDSEPCYSRAAAFIVWCCAGCWLPAPAPHGRSTAPCRADRRSAGASGAATELHCRKTSECEGRGGRNCYRRLFLVTGKSWRRGGRGGAAPWLRLRGRPCQPVPSDWKEVSESERVFEEWAERRKHFAYSGFSSRRHQVSTWKRWQRSLLVDEWHLCRLSILLLLQLQLELSKLSKLCLSISQILAWPALSSSTTKLKTSSDPEKYFWQWQDFLHFFKFVILGFVVRYSWLMVNPIHWHCLQKLSA